MIVRPDGRRFVREPAEAADIGGDLYATVAADDEAALQGYLDAGFAVHRREHRYLVPTRTIGGVSPPPGFELLPADRVDEDDLRELDDLLRQDVPGTDGWRWTPEAFREETYASPHFDPTVYVVARESASRREVGIVRVWMRPERPRLGFVGVARPYRRRGIARSLLAHAFATLAGRGIAAVTTEIDETNVASRALLEGVGARRTGTSLELLRRGSSLTRH